MEIVKAEILFSRQCPLDCSYCGMKNEKQNNRSINEWFIGLENLKSLGCQFAAFYGAEILMEFDKLKKVVGYSESIGIATTIITSGAVPDFKKKLRELYDNGARSLTMSNDLCTTDPSSRRKTEQTLSNLQFFNEYPECRDVASITTLTRQNFHHLPEAIKKHTEMGIWTFFDFIHPDRGLPGTKCRGNAEGFVFEDEDFPKLAEVMDEVCEMKEQDYLVHVSKEYINLMKQNDFSLLKNYNWNCAKLDVFPSWVTIDCDGSVHYCDDFQEQRKQPKFDMTTLFKDWDKFCRHGKKLVGTRCRGCAWSTHIDAHYIKMGINDIDSYVHGRT